MAGGFESQGVSTMQMNDSIEHAKRELLEIQTLLLNLPESDRIQINECLEKIRRATDSYPESISCVAMGITALERVVKRKQGRN
jgi:hypothetical protein